MPFRVLTCCLLVSIALMAAPVAGQTPSESPKALDAESLRGEVARLLLRLDSNDFAVRQQAAAGLEALVARPELAGPLAAEFDRVLSQLDISFEVRWHLQRWSDRLPRVAPEQAEACSPQQIDELIDRLSDDSYSVRLGAARALQRLLVQDEHLPYLKQALPARLTGRLDPGAAVEIRKLLDLTRPAMVAEYWRGGHHEGEQHLYVGVPSQTEGAPRPSHFDRIDDLTAHCVSGTNLSPGDYPVGVAFPHPKEVGAFFRLVNLPTPRRRLEYDREVKTDEAARLAAISRRTLDHFLQEPRDLTESELTMLGQLDASEVSRFAGRYFLLVDDKPLPDSEGRRGVGRASRFGWICSLLAIAGTKDAMPGLLEALDKHCFLPPTSEAPYRLHWLAALSIAARDRWPASGAWPDTDAWLISLIDNDEAILEGREGGPELGATAAGVLLRHHKQPPSLFGLLATPEPLMTRFRIDGYTFRPHQTKDDDPRQKVRQWWESQREQEKQP